MKRILRIFKLIKLLWKSKKLSEIEDIIPIIETSRHLMILFSNEDESTEQNILIYVPDESINVDFSVKCRSVVRDMIARTVGGQSYENELEKYDYDMAMAYKEIDYQTLRNDALESEYMYFKEINNPYGMKGPQLLHLWQRSQELKKRVEDYK